MSRLGRGVVEKLAKQGYIPITDAAKRIEANRATVYRWVVQKHVESKQILSVTYVKWSSVLSHLGPEACAVLKLVADKTTKQESRVARCIAKKEKPTAKVQAPSAEEDLTPAPWGVDS